MTTLRLQVARTARVELLGEPAEGVREVWLVLHGYGELAADFARRFEGIAAPERLVAAPEGLSRFYLRGGSGTVGASWMTREERACEISDQVAYLDRVRAALVAAGVPAGARFHVLGFSQGGAAAARWAAATAATPARLVIWAASVPPDLDVAACAERWRELEVALVAGERDRRVSPRDLEDERARLAAAGVRAELVRFDGGHEIDGTTLTGLVRK